MTVVLEELARCARAVASGASDALAPVPEGDPLLGGLAEALNELVQATLRARREARATERELHQKQSVLKYIIANLPHRIWWKDREGRFLGANENFLHDMQQASVEELLGKTDSDLPFPRPHAELFREIDREVMERGVPRLDLEEPQLRPDGLHTLQTSKVPLRDEQGHVIGTLGLFVDITERKQMEEALQRAKEQAEAAAHAKSDFLTLMSHELRTPLTLILGPLQSLLDGAVGELAPPVRDFLERIQRNAARLGALVNDILDFSKLEAGMMRVHWESVDPGEVIGALVDDALASASGKRIQLGFRSELGTGTLSLDRQKLEKITLNLVSNALKFTPEGGQVDVRLRRDGEWLELSVTDSGPGIAAGEQARLFQRFQQLDGSLTRRHEGTGIGLAIVKEFAELMGGQVGLESAPGLGARFWVRLPASADHVASSAPRLEARAAPARPTPRPLEPAPGPPAAQAPDDAPRLLVAEDNADMLAYVVELLGAEYRIEAVADGVSALAAARARTPDVILSDVMMPAMDGLELAARLKADDALRVVPVILLTAKASREELAGGLAAGADDYLAKPFSPLELRARVRAAERLHRLVRALERERTELAETLAHLRETQEQLIHSAKMAAIGTLVVGLAHELNNPLGVILLTAQTQLKRLGADTGARSPFAVIARHAQRCGGMVTALLDVSRRKPLLREDATVASLIERATALVAASRHKDVELQASVEPELPVLNVCVQEIESALINVIANSFDATPVGGRVALSASARAQGGAPGVEIAVTDNGCGIQADVLPHVFDPFFTLKQGGAGTGLGLSITRGIVDAHRGRIHIESQVGRGTTVRIWLPAAAGAA